MSDDKNDDLNETILALISDSVEPMDIVKETQQIRKEILRDRLSNGLPKEKDDVKIVMDTLRDMDISAVSVARLDIDTKANDNAAIVKDCIAAMAGKELFKSSDDNTRKDEPAIDRSKVKEYDRVEGEDIQGNDPIDPKKYLA